MFIGNSQLSIYALQSNSDWMYNIQSKVLHSDWLMLDSIEKATLHINIFTFFKCSKRFIAIYAGYLCWLFMLAIYAGYLCWLFMLTEKMCNRV